MNVNDAHRCKMNGCTGETTGTAWIPDGAFITGNVHIIKFNRFKKKEKKVSWKFVHWFRRRRFLKVFTIYGHGGNLGHVTWTIYTNFGSPFPRRLHIKFWFDWPSSFEEKMFENGLRRQQRRRTPEHVYTIRSPMSLCLR